MRPHQHWVDSGVFFFAYFLWKEAKGEHFLRTNNCGLLYWQVISNARGPCAEPPLKQSLAEAKAHYWISSMLYLAYGQQHTCYIDHDGCWYQKTFEPILKCSTYWYRICSYGGSWLIVPLGECVRFRAVQHPLHKPDVWLIKCCRVLKATVYGFPLHPRGEQDDKGPAFLSSSTFSQCLY